MAVHWVDLAAVAAAGADRQHVAGLILLAAAPCTAMVFVWSNLTDGKPNFTLTQVALNDTIMVFAFAPIVGLLLHRVVDDRLKDRYSQPVSYWCRTE